jgi:hypothetical protein
MIVRRLIFISIKKYSNKFYIIIVETKSYLLKKIQLFVEYGLQSKDELYLIKISEKIGSIILYLHGKI